MLSYDWILVVHGCMDFIHFSKQEEAMSPSWPMLKMNVPSLAEIENNREIESIIRFKGKKLREGI